MKQYHCSTYIMANQRNTVLYVGATANLVKRVWQHKQKFFKDSFSSQYNINKLVYYENFQYIRDARNREKQLKAGPRKKKTELIERENPQYKDLAERW
ncbi:MAG: GIY-YIG nuclease family protein [Parcubacteria group bacterium]